MPYLWVFLPRLAEQNKEKKERGKEKDRKALDWMRLGSGGVSEARKAALWKATADFHT